MNKPVEFTDIQLDRIDEVLNATFDLCRVLTENENLEWNMSFIGEIADVACDILVNHGFHVRYPAIVKTEDGEKVVDFHDEF